MTLEMELFTVEIKAKHLGSNRMNKADTEWFLNTLSIYASEAAKSFERDNLKALAEEAKQISDDIYNTLKTAGVYN